MRERSIAMSILLLILTCGLYGIYWFVVLTDEAGEAAGEPDFNGMSALLFTIITCGLYGFYWHYKMGKVMYEANMRAGINANDNSLIYLLLSLFKLSIINYCIIQDELNTIARIGNNTTVIN